MLTIIDSNKGTRVRPLRCWELLFPPDSLGGRLHCCIDTYRYNQTQHLLLGPFDPPQHPLVRTPPPPPQTLLQHPPPPTLLHDLNKQGRPDPTHACRVRGRRGGGGATKRCSFLPNEIKFRLVGHARPPLLAAVQSRRCKARGATPVLHLLTITSGGNQSIRLC